MLNMYCERVRKTLLYELNVKHFVMGSMFIETGKILYLAATLNEDHELGTTPILKTPRRYT